jgi:hypothetical protein
LILQRKPAILLRSFVIQAAILAQEHYKQIVLRAVEVLNLMREAGRAVRIFMMLQIQIVESVTILVLLVALALPQVVSHVNLDLPSILQLTHAILQRLCAILLVKLVVGRLKRTVKLAFRVLNSTPLLVLAVLIITIVPQMIAETVILLA